jgi:hypothetical protein
LPQSADIQPHIDQTPLLKLVLTADMLLGRVEILALLVVLYPSSWLELLSSLQFWSRFQAPTGWKSFAAQGYR